MESRDIDKTHIITLREVNGKFQNMELSITRPEQFISELKAMIDNPNRTVWDMQSYFTTRFHKSNRYLDYIYPYSYNSSFVGGIQYPQLSGYDELRKSWADAGNVARESYFASCEHNGAKPVPIEATQAETKAVNRVY